MQYKITSGGQPVNVIPPKKPKKPIMNPYEIRNPTLEKAKVILEKLKKANNS